MSPSFDGGSSSHPVRRILRMSIAHTPNPEPTSPVVAPTAEPMNRAFAHSGHTSRPVIVFWNGSLIRRPQSGQVRLDNAIFIASLVAFRSTTRPTGVGDGAEVIVRRSEGTNKGGRAPLLIWHGVNG